MKHGWLLIQPWSASFCNSCKPQCSALSQKPHMSIWDLYWSGKWPWGSFFSRLFGFPVITTPWIYHTHISFVYYRRYGSSATDSHRKQSTSLSVKAQLIFIDALTVQGRTECETYHFRTRASQCHNTKGNASYSCCKSKILLNSWKISL